MKPTAIGTGGQFVAGVLLGIVSGVVGIAFGLVSAFAAVVFVVLVGLLMPRFAALSGGLVGLGGTWLLLNLNDLIRCPDPANFCGDAQVVIPWLTVSAVIALVGGATAVLTLTSAAAGRKNGPGGGGTRNG